MKCWRCGNELTTGDAPNSAQCRRCEQASISSSPASAGSDVSRDGTDRLCMAVYGRPAEPRDYIGGANAQMLYDAADMIEALRQNRQLDRKANANENDNGN